jgi:8-oxo-dGTP diphosphatase
VINPGETPLECVRREVREETGLDLLPEEFIFIGLVTWDGAPETGEAGMYVYFAHWPEDKPRSTTDGETEEGRLSWLPMEWCLSWHPEVVSNIHLFFGSMYDAPRPLNYRLEYDQAGQIVDYEVLPLPAGIDQSTGCPEAPLETEKGR